MSSNWRDFLKSSGAVIEHDLVLSFSPAGVAEEAAVEDWLTDLSCLSVLQVSGADAAEFLQAQFCNDLQLLAAGNSDVKNVPQRLQLASSAAGDEDAQAGATDAALMNGVQLTGYCSPKGRLLALFWIFQRNDGSFNLLLPRELAPSIAKRLSMFVLRAKVTVEDVTSSLAIIALGGAAASAALDANFASSNSETAPGAFSASDVVAVSETEGNVFVKLPGHGSCWVLLVPQSAAESVWGQLASNLTPVGMNRWELAGIQAAIPMVRESTADKLIPQMLNMQAVDGLSFKKGCYPGQEIVARMQYLGKLKRRMYLLEIATADNSDNFDSCPEVGSVITTQEDADAGVVVRVAVAGAAKYLALVVLKNDLPIDTLMLQGHPQASLKALELPYRLEG